ncbi:MAG: VOC family protein [Victivallaceae bacterium]|nr:VOC family protein [Victivallaceae bacterium]
MKKNKFGLLLRVRDLDECRDFYRTLLGLGEPIFDSSFRTEFELNGEIRLILEHTGAEYLEHEAAAQSWIYTVDDPEGVADRLRASGFEVKLMPAPDYDQRLLRCLDPESNVFFLCKAMPE